MCNGAWGRCCAEGEARWCWPRLCCWQMEALQQQWDNTSAAMEALQQEDKRCRKHIGRLQQQTEVRNTMPVACTWSL